MKGILLAGGKGTRLYPNTQVVSKQLLPVYDKPMIYYPISTLMLAGIRDILIITTPESYDQFVQLLGSGSQWGLNFNYCIQSSPDGLAQAFILAEHFIGNDHCSLVLGDNIFYGNDFANKLKQAQKENLGATIFAYPVIDPENYGVVTFDRDGRAVKLEEKPKITNSSYAVTGLYFYNNDVIGLAKQLTPSLRGELEITDLNQMYLDQQKLNVVMMGRGYAWLDTGTCESLLDAGLFIQTLEKRQGLKIACPEEIAYRMGYISASDLEKLAVPLLNNRYGKYLQGLLLKSHIVA